MSGPVIVRSVLVGGAAVTALVPAARIIADEVAPQDIELPLILIKHVSGVDRHTLSTSSPIFTRKRVQVEIHAANATSRADIKAAVRSAGFSSTHPTVTGFEKITLHTEGEGPDFHVEGSNVRIGEQDFLVTYSEEI